MNRATAVLADWDNHVSHSAASKHDQAQATEITPPSAANCETTETSDNDSKTKSTPPPRSSRP